MNNNSSFYKRVLLHQKIYFPGEIIFDDIIVEYLTFIEIVKIKNYHGMILRPIQEFNIAKPNSKELNNALEQINKDLNFNITSSLTTKSKTKKKESFDLVNSSIWLENIETLTDPKTKYIYKIVKDKHNTENYNLALMKEEAINILNFLSKKLIDEKLKLTLCVKNYQYIEPQTVLGHISTVPDTNLEIERIKKLKLIKKIIHFIITKKVIFIQKKAIW